jgi:hypothetical protein
MSLNFFTVLKFRSLEKKENVVRQPEQEEQHRHHGFLSQEQQNREHSHREQRTVTGQSVPDQDLSVPFQILKIDLVWILSFKKEKVLIQPISS